MLNNRLTQSGKCVITATDDADNTITYQFTLMIYLDSNGWIFVLVIVLVIAAIVTYLVLQRKKLRVR